MDATIEIPPDDVHPARLEPSKPPMIRNDLKRLRHGEPVVDSQRTTSSFSPIRLLSMEILQLVFLFAASHQPHEYATYLKWSASPRRKQSWAGALSLTWVCSWWQKVALSYPTIWRSIHIDVTVSQFSPKGSDNQLFFVVFVGECLRRSGPCLALDIGLNLNVDIGNFRFHKSNEGLGLCDLRGVFDTLAFFAGRWRRIEISSEFSNSFHNLTETLVTSMAASNPTTPMTIPLQEFELHYPHYLYDSTFGDAQPKFLTHCHRIRFLKVFFLTTTDDMDLSNLVFLRVSFYHKQSFYSRLRRSPRLKYLGMGDVGTIPTSESASVSTSPGSCTPSIVHTYLTSLSLTWVGLSAVPKGVWANVSLPNLTRLGITFNLTMQRDGKKFVYPFQFSRHSILFEGLKLMCIRSGCRLHKIQISLATQPSTETQKIYDVLEEFPRSEGSIAEISEEPTNIEREAYLEYIDEL